MTSTAASVEPIPELPLEDYRRYGRQMILDGFGLPGQLRLHNASVAVVGAGGLGCPALQYLAAAGVGTIGVIDHDSVELSNLQRQVLHNKARIGVSKAVSAAEAVRQINSTVKINPVVDALTQANALELLAPYDVILDCTDNLPTRYLLSDTAVRLGRPLVSGAAQRFEGQLAIYNLPLKDDGGVEGSPPRGPCFRCLFPSPPAPDMVGSCEELGVLGAVTGVIGNLQALETIKLLTGLHEGKPTLLMFNALSTSPFRTVKLRNQRLTCAACGSDSERVGKIEDTDYVAFCGGARPDWVSRGLIAGRDGDRVTPKELRASLDDPEQAIVVLDVRPRTEFGICHLPGSLNIPIKELLANPSIHETCLSTPDKTVYVVCRLGNDSQLATDALREAGRTGAVKDLIGGLQAWTRDVDTNFPVY
ncbi:uncharacterized protein BXZ73DRAFT_46213 [Epithele typhae]|uniref:uncharacterized protein n=1 Tax=Epithele typhae TaxID=378194 RepID=UPI002007B518|nr:uncharacterized protein BXZ73DRAFT_46213 [Epithele typhae]KAH9933670.1 hypothetical protein BXZ73DRAFT_46213 [Epithele typhae]